MNHHHKLRGDFQKMGEVVFGTGMKLGALISLNLEIDTQLAPNQAT